MSATQYEIERHLDEGVVVFTPTGPLDEMELDAQFAYCAKFFADNPHAKGAVFNLTFVARITSKAIGLIADLAGRLEEAGSKLILAHADKISDALHICGIDEIIAVRKTLADAKKEIMAGPTASAAPKKAAPAPAAEPDAVTFFSTRPEAASFQLGAPEPVAAPAPAAAPVEKPVQATEQELAVSPLFKFLDAAPASQSVEQAAALPGAPGADLSAFDVVPKAAPEVKPVPAAPVADLSAFTAPAPAPKAKAAPAPVSDVLVSGGFSVDPAAQMGAILKDAATKLRANLAGFDARAKDLEEALAAKDARIAAYQDESKALKAELKSLEKEEARVQAALRSFQTTGA